jgi:hypothetical protein
MYAACIMALAGYDMNECTCPYVQFSHVILVFSIPWLWNNRHHCIGGHYLFLEMGEISPQLLHPRDAHGFFY